MRPSEVRTVVSRDWVEASWLLMERFKACCAQWLVGRSRGVFGRGASAEQFRAAPWQARCASRRHVRAGGRLAADGSGRTH